MDEVLREMNARCGSDVHLTCTPLREYKDFCAFLGADKDKTSATFPTMSTKGDYIYFVRFDVDYPGMKTIEQQRLTIAAYVIRYQLF